MEEAVRGELGDFPLVVDANQQWNRGSAARMGRLLGRFDLLRIEEPLDAYDVRGRADLARELATPVATGQMLTSPAEYEALIRAGAVGFMQPDAPRVGGHHPRSWTSWPRGAGPERGWRRTSPWRSTCTRPLPTNSTPGALRLAPAPVRGAVGDRGRAHARSGPARPGRAWAARSASRSAPGPPRGPGWTPTAART
ncbi:enolase C-terminal domain-like protein [Nocardiopsis akebiae]|uniref:enolase C-terminal domain-like protein n=1 Tax=Nocardiopsis akebiae TaxID=2831968 RepID=UPI0023DF9FFC|nr:enolase C-terminal domain-like protein [Nocardiopsis akebiae]